MTVRVDPAFYEDRRPSGERRLFQAVILNAIREATNQFYAGIHPMLEKRIQRQALLWFVKAGADFQEVCHHAGLEPQGVRKASLAYITHYNADPSKAVRLAKLNANAKRVKRRASNTNAAIVAGQCEIRL
ncbi:hypothetical protein H5J25_09600 [Sphingomonas aliaeris]|uniref:Uncharacterized protein n=1 Tax=Sphingomonas aliaeris TaxID=2759526 RepID=A0A974NS43_9SPHN|nr:hypothetical protein [Sphingomonas aliaeris]QQV75871.1 hypothetical protein H5J25_09600 [Sphingomonas aliaeris]